MASPLTLHRRAPTPLPIDEHWTCRRSGDCCTKPGEVVMTKEEAAVLVHHAPKEIAMHFRPTEDGFVAMKAGPCPLYAFKGCLVYSVRPYNCRRFACMRPDPKTEPFDERMSMDSSIMQRARQSRAVRRLLIHIQRKAQRWAVNHGWVVS